MRQRLFVWKHWPERSSLPTVNVLGSQPGVLIATAIFGQFKGASQNYGGGHAANTMLSDAVRDDLPCRHLEWRRGQLKAATAKALGIDLRIDRSNAQNKTSP